MVLRWLFRKLFRKDAPAAVLYVPSVMGILLCYLTFHQHRLGNPAADIVVALLNAAFVLFTVALNLRRFVGTLRKPYQPGNLHAALGSVFAVVTMFAAIYAILSLHLPGSFAGLDGGTPLDECVAVVYFSATIITTVGFGDIHAVASLARVFVTIEMMSFFVFFVVILGSSKSFIRPPDEPAALPDGGPAEAVA